MRAWIPAVVALAACGNDDKPTARSAAKLVAPNVTVATVLAVEDPKPPFLVILDSLGNSHLVAAASWPDLDAGRVRIARPTPLEPLDRFIREEIAFGKASVESVKRWDEYAATPMALDLEEAALAPEDDPPPPEEEDKPDDGEEEVYGTYVHVTLDEGKMGKKDSDREEGQYKMVKTPADPQLARQQAIEMAHAAGILGGGGRGLDTFNTFGQPSLRSDGMPSRVSEVTGIVVTGPLENLRAMVLVAPAAPAIQLVETVRDRQYAIAVMHAGKLRPLRLQFGREGWSTSPNWVEVRVSPNAIVVEGVPDTAIEVANPSGIATALADARASRDIDTDAQVDVLVDPSLDAQRLVDVLVALDTAGVRAIGLGSMPSTDQLERRGRRLATMMLGHPNSQGDLEKALIRRTVKQSSQKIRACYERVLRFWDPTLRGTVQTQFFITPNGDVAVSSASGVHSALSYCVAGVIKTLQFPKPKGGGGVQVNYPFTFRP